MEGKAFVCQNWILGLALLALTGCHMSGPGPRTLQNNWVDYGSAYGDANNRQLLLNLARLANDDPVNFLQLGSFSAQYTYNTTLGFSESDINNTPAFYPSSQTLAAGGSPPGGANTFSTVTSEFTKNMLTLGGTAMATISESPTFQFFPLTGSNIVAATLAPISEKVFYTFYDQGYPADLAARTMIASVRRQVPTYDLHTGKVNGTNYQYLVNSPSDRSYPEFLNFCALLYRAQQAHVITVADSPDGPTLIYSGTNAKLTDVLSAVQANLAVTFVKDKAKKGPGGGGGAVPAPMDTTTTQSKTEVTTTTTPPAGAQTVTSTTKASKTLTTKPGTKAGGKGDPQGGLAGHYEIKQPPQAKHFAIDKVDILYKLKTPVSSEPGLGEKFIPAADPKLNHYVADNQDPDRQLNFVTRLADDFQHPNLVLKMRTVEAAMYTVAQESSRYRNLADPASPAAIDFSNNAGVERQMEALVKVIKATRAKLQKSVTAIHAEIGRTIALAPGGGMLFAVPAPAQPPPMIDVTANIASLDQAELDLTQASGLPSKAYAEDPPAGLTGGLAEMQRKINLNEQKTTQAYVTSVNPMAPTLAELQAGAAAWVADRDGDAADLTSQIKYFTRVITRLQQVYFRCTIEYGTDHFGPFAVVTRPDGSKFQTRPLMKLTREPGEDPMVKATAEVFYPTVGGEPYYVADPVIGPAGKRTVQNRTVFTMLTYLFAQTSVSTQNLPVQQLIQVH